MPEQVARLYSEETGSGDPVVLLHGWAMNLRVFDALRAELEAHHRVIAVDLPGHGRSAWPRDHSYARQLELLGAMLPPGATVIGWSLGGQLAMALAAATRYAVRRLVLIASTPRFVAAPGWPHGLRPATLERFAEALELDADGTVLDFLQLQVRGSRHAEETIRTLRAALRGHGSAQPEALRAGLALLRANDLRELARTLQVPTLLIAGQYDRVTLPAAAQALAALIPQAQLCELPRAGHAPFLSHRHEVSDALRHFLSVRQPVAHPAGAARV
jgi:pimeloyl-[acyl-carrier protein] methyl ester esterase